MGGKTQAVPNEDGSVDTEMTGFVKKDYEVDGKLVMYMPKHMKFWKWSGEQASVTPDKDRYFKWHS